MSVMHYRDAVVWSRMMQPYRENTAVCHQHKSASELHDDEQ